MVWVTCPSQKISRAQLQSWCKIPILCLSQNANLAPTLEGRCILKAVSQGAQFIVCLELLSIENNYMCIKFNFLRQNKIVFWIIKEWVSFFSGFMGVWIVARDKQIAWTAKRFSGDLFVPRYDSYPHEPRKKDTHSLYSQCFQQGLFLKFSEKSY